MDHARLDSADRQPPDATLGAMAISGAVTIRPARAADAPAVAEIWCQGWQDGHLGHVPDELLAARTDTSFATRAAERTGDTAVATVGGAVAGFVMVVDDEVEQVYVAASHRGTAVAAALLAEAERLIRAGGHERAWLAVVAGNTRARRFYERNGWVDDGAFDHLAEGPDGPIRVPAHRYVKALPAEG
jgi:GNAT superfamily N-acetyltransferase